MTAYATLFIIVLIMKTRNIEFTSNALYSLIAVSTFNKRKQHKVFEKTATFYSYNAKP